MFKGFKEIVPLMMAGILIGSAISAFRDAIGGDVSMLFKLNESQAEIVVERFFNYLMAGIAWGLVIISASILILVAPGNSPGKEK